MPRKILEINVLKTSVDLPMWASVAVSADRSELLPVLAPKTLNETDTKCMVNLVKTLMDTNRSLRQHSLEVSEAANRLFQESKTTARHLEELSAQAAFETLPEDEDEVYS